MVKPVNELRLLAPLVDGSPGEVHVDLHLAAVEVAGDDVGHQLGRAEAQTVPHGGRDDVGAGVPAVVDERPVLGSRPGGHHVAGVGTVQVSPLGPAEEELLSD